MRLFSQINSENISDFQENVDRRTLYIQAYGMSNERTFDFQNSFIN